MSNPPTQQSLLEPTSPTPPAQIGVASIVAHLPYTDTKRFLGSPAIVNLDNGTRVVSHDIFGTDSGTDETYVYSSSDGHSWTQIAHLQDLFWASLFQHRGALYLLGTTREYGALVIRRSVDDGHTWTEPTGPDTGLLSTDRFHTSPVPVVAHQGQLVRAVERYTGIDHEWGRFAAAIMHVTEDANLLHAHNWTISPGAEVPQHLGQTGLNTWLEGNIITGPDDQLCLLLRADDWTQQHQTAIKIPIDLSRSHIAVEQAIQIAMPGGGSKFTVRKDTDDTYWSIVNTALFDASTHLGLRARNTLALIHSADLEDWTVRRILQHHPDDQHHGYQYVDWIFDGNDLAAVVRTAHEFKHKPAASYHDSNLITHLRVPNYRCELS